MRIEIVSIGDELLSGRIVNSNVAFLCKQLQMHGYMVAQQTTLSDQRQALLRGFKEVLSRADIIIATGGLGPTLDDETRQVAAELFGSDFYFNEELAKELHARQNNEFFAIEDQARVPTKALTLPNRVGSAPGLVFSDKGKTLILLPGVPQEMEPLFLEEVLPFLQKKVPSQHKETVLLHFCLLYESLLDCPLRKLSAQHPHVTVGIYPAYGTLTVSLSATHAQKLFPFQTALKNQFGSYLYSAPSGKVEEALLLTCLQKKKKIACAESCTGGRIAACITSIPGASDYFLGSLITYSNEMKKQLLGVSAQTLSQKGAVSEETVREMLESVFRQTTADYAIAVSGIAGPAGGSKEKPPGTVCAAIGERGQSPDVGRFHIAGSREKVIMVTTQSLLGALWRKIEKKIPAFPFLDSSIS